MKKICLRKELPLEPSLLQTLKRTQDETEALPLGHEDFT